MAELFVARHVRDELPVVIKRILPHLTGEEDFVRMFLDEARIAAQLHHPNIVQVNELGRLGGSLFLAMEYVEGVDLRKLLRRSLKQGQSVPYAVAARVVAEICKGLHYAHNATGVDGKPLRVIHRDVSPQNVMVGYDGHVKLVDFGIAKAGAMVERSKPGIIKGKFLYLSPEQVAQEKIDHRADLFALGTMLYEVTTGRPPFQKSTTEGVIYAIRAEEPPAPHLVKADYPPELEAIVLRCLVKNRDHRYSTAEEVEIDLENWLDGQATPLEQVAAYANELMGGVQERTLVHLPEFQPPPPPRRRTVPPEGDSPERTVTETDSVRVATPDAAQAPTLPPEHAYASPPVLMAMPPPAPPREGRRPTIPETSITGTDPEDERPEPELEDFTDPGLVPAVSREPETRADRPPREDRSGSGNPPDAGGRVAERAADALHRLLIKNK